MSDSMRHQGHPPLDPDAADRLLEKLGTDDGFRDTFIRDPGAALQQIGVLDPSAALVGASCMRANQLASKEEIQASRETLQNYLTSTGTHTVVFCFESGKVSASLRRR